MKIALVGYGRMGKTIEALALHQGDEVVARINHADDADWAYITDADVAIEFSQPQVAFHNVVRCLEASVPVVCGTTAWLEHLDAAKSCAEKHKTALLYASNFSVGVNLFFALNKKLAALMAPHTQYNVRMQEIHHIHKLDAPSGTAVTLAEDILAQRDTPKAWALKEEAAASDLPIEAVREGEVFGTHRIGYYGTVDEIEIQHKANSREGFAQGALLAAHWIKGRQGFFGMQDVLGLD